MLYIFIGLSRKLWGIFKEMIEDLKSNKQIHMDPGLILHSKSGNPVIGKQFG